MMKGLSFFRKRNCKLFACFVKTTNVLAVQQGSGANTILILPLVISVAIIVDGNSVSGLPEQF